MAACYRCKMVGKTEPDLVPGALDDLRQRRPVQATTSREGKPVCEGHAREYDDVERPERVSTAAPKSFIKVKTRGPVR